MNDASQPVVPAALTPAPPSWDHWHAAHREVLRRYLVRSLGSERHLAEDLLQDVFARALASSERLAAEGDPKSFLFRVATNLLIDHHRRKAVRREAPLPGDDAPGMETSAPDPEAQAIREDMRRRLRDAVARLPDAEREVFLLREHGDVPFKEIASRTSAPLGTVLGRMRQALRRLAAELGNEP